MYGVIFFNEILLIHVSCFELNEMEQLQEHQMFHPKNDLSINYNTYNKIKLILLGWKDS